MNISVLIGTCDAYSPLWKNFDILFQKYWQLPTKNILVSETEVFSNNHYQTVTPGKKPWGERVLESLELIDTEYVFFILDDYYLTESFTQEFIDDHIKILEKHNAVKIMTDIDYGEPIYYLEHIEEDLYKFKMTSDYLNSIQPAIWKTSYLKQVLKPDYSPWDFEIKGNDFTKTLNPIILLKARPEHMYFNFVRIGGRISEGWEQLYIKENLQ
jgi:hypothetical protein